MKKHRWYYVYIVECVYGTYYTGSTHDVEQRLQLHNTGRGAKYLRGKGPVKLVYCRRYRSRSNALRAESAVKKLTRTQKETLIRMDSR